MLHTLSAFPLFFITCLGLVLGSFSSLLIHRLHNDEIGIINGRSKCTKCKHRLGVLNLIPVLSWVIQKGKCSFCKTKISAIYPLLEISFGLLFFLFAQKMYPSVELIPVLWVVFFALVFFYYDLWYFEVDQRLTIPAIAGVLLWAFFREEGVQTFLIGGAIGFSFYALQYWISKGKWVGDGDQQLALFIGLVLGWKLTLGALFLSYILGSFIALPLLIFKKANGETPLPMGAFLMPALLVFLYTDTWLWNWYIQLLGFFG